MAGRPTRGFFCDDYTIRYPYKPDTVSTVGVGLYGYLIPLLLVRLVKNLIFCLQIIIVEILIATYKRCADGDYNSFKKVSVILVHPQLRHIWTSGVATDIQLWHCVFYCWWADTFGNNSDQIQSRTPSATLY